MKCSGVRAHNHQVVHHSSWVSCAGSQLTDTKDTKDMAGMTGMSVVPSPIVGTYFAAGDPG
jgi:hypothetical protein